jgi:hypothetical protein
LLFYYGRRLAVADHVTHSEEHEIHVVVQVVAQLKRCPCLCIHAYSPLAYLVIDADESSPGVFQAGLHRQLGQTPGIHIKAIMVLAQLGHAEVVADLHVAVGYCLARCHHIRIGTTQSEDGG